MNDCEITGQEHSKERQLYILESAPEGTHSLKIPLTSKIQAGRIQVIAENSAGRAIAAANLRITGECWVLQMFLSFLST